MRKWLISATVLLAVALPAMAGEIIDRIVATVNGHIILLSDWDEAVRYEAFMDGRSPDAVSQALRKAALDRLIDQELLREQIRSSDSQYSPSGEEVARRILEIRKQYPGANDDALWKQTLTRYHLSEEELQHRVALQLSLMKLVDDRIRPTIQIDPNSIESYYQESLLPQLRKSGEKEVPLAEVTPKIKELLTQEKEDQLLTAWLQNLRASSEIRTGDAGAAGGQAQ
ncbi:MAG TPA: SurA N-terminal domain-containing protein [Terriglobales bacterium]|nr:SurA N-terminal domain-containing protein [Terriglobales bacterium]